MALDLARRGLFLIPLCWPNENGECACPQNHQGHNVGKAPLTKNGVKDSSQSIRDIWEWWDRYPEANIGVDLDKSGLVAIAPDSPEWHHTFQERGLPETAVVQSGGGEGHVHYYYRRPEDTPLININLPDAYDIQPRGYVVAVGSLHQSGRTYEWVSDHNWRDVEDLPYAPEWALQEIQERWESHSVVPEIDVDLTQVQLRPELVKGPLEEWWNGNITANLDNGTTDRSLTLFVIGKKLANQGATPEEIVVALRDRDEALEFCKYSRRKDGGLKAYSAIAQRVTAPKAEPPQSEVEEDVPIRATKKKIYSSPNRDEGSERSALWRSAQEYFPMPPGVRPYVKGAVFRNRRTGKEVWGNFYGHTWRNSANAQHHRQAVYFNILPKINGPQMYLRYVAPDDWNHGTIVKAINRVKAKTEDDDHGWVGFDNALERGHYVYLTSVPGVPGFEPVEGDIEPILVDALKALHPPDRGEEGRYHGYWGSANWTKRAEIADEDDQDVCDLLAVSDHPLDKVQVEAECRASGVRCEEIRRYWRRQVGEGLETSLGDERAVRLAVYMGYRPTKHGRAVLAASGGDNSGREEPVGAVDATLESPDSGGWGERWVVMI